jgi:ABC-type sugar transport system ATPase subunit
MTIADRAAVLDRGAVQQVGTPESLYRAPANRFVASFIGSPSMNLFDTHLDAGTFRLCGVPIKTAISMSGAVTISIRPEAIECGAGVTGRLRWIEMLGGRFLASLECEDVTLTALLRDRPRGDTMTVSIDPNHIHVFDKDSGRNLGLHLS